MTGIVGARRHCVTRQSSTRRRCIRGRVASKRRLRAWATLPVMCGTLDDVQCSRRWSHRNIVGEGPMAESFEPRLFSNEKLIQTSASCLFTIRTDLVPELQADMRRLTLLLVYVCGDEASEQTLHGRFRSLRHFLSRRASPQFGINVSALRSCARAHRPVPCLAAMGMKFKRGGVSRQVERQCSSVTRRAPRPASRGAC